MKMMNSLQSIPEMVDGLSCEEARRMFKGGKLMAYGRSMAKILDRALPPEKVDEWGFLLSRKGREAIKREGDDKVEIRASFLNSLELVAGLGGRIVAESCGRESGMTEIELLPAMRSARVGEDGVEEHTVI